MARLLTKQSIVWLIIFTLCGYMQVAAAATRPSEFLHYNHAWTALLESKFSEATHEFKLSKKDLRRKYKWLADDGLAWVDFYKGKYEDARNAFHHVIDKNPNAYLSYKGLGLIALKNGYDDYAITQLVRSFKIYPYQPIWSYTSIAYELIKEKLYWSANRVLDYAESAYPLSGDIALARARLQLIRGERNTAYNNLIKASYYSPLAVDEALKTIRIYNLSKRKAVLINVGWGNFFAGRYEKGLSQFNLILEDDKDDVAALRGKAYCLMRLGKFRPARNILRYLVHHNSMTVLPSVHEAFYTKFGKKMMVHSNSETMLGWAHYNLNNYHAALDIFHRQLARHPSWISPRLGLSYVQEDLNKPHLAARNLAMVERRAPGYSSASKHYKSGAIFGARISYGNFSSNAPKNNSRKIRLSGGYQFSTGTYINTLFEFNRLVFDTPAERNNMRLGYEIIVPFPHTTPVAPILDLKGNYIIKSSYAAAGSRLYPYFGMIFENRGRNKIVDIGYARGRYRAPIFSRIDQFTAGYGQYSADEYWFYQGRLYYIKESSTGISAGHESLQFIITRYFDRKHSVTVNGMLGKRVHAYDIYLNTVYDLHDQQSGSIGLSYNFETLRGHKWFLDGSFEKYSADTTGANYHVFYITVGVNI